MKGRDIPGISNNFILNFGLEKDDNMDKHVLDTENLRIGKKNVYKNKLFIYRNN